TTTIGSAPGGTTQDGGTLRLSGSAALPTTTQGITVGQGAVLELNNASGNNNDRLPDAATITLSGGTLKIVGAGLTNETVGPVNLTGNTSNTIAADGAILTMMGMNRSGGATLNLQTTTTLGGLSTDATRIEFSGQLNTPDQSNSPSNIPSLANGILPW